MVTLVIVKNPFEPWNGREIKQIVPGDTVKQLRAGYELPGLEMVVSINGSVAEPGTVIQDDDFVVICPVVGKGGKNILGMIAMIALSVVAMGVGSGVAGAGWFSSGGIAAAKVSAMAAFGGYLTAASIMFIGSQLIGRAFGTKADTGKYNGTTEATYSWDGVSTMEGQNNSVAMTYGTVMSGGQSIAKNVTVVDNDEYLNWLVAAGEGPLEISDIQVNDNPVSYYQGMTVDIREGTNCQEVIPNFNDTFFTKTLGYQLLETERIDKAQGNATEGIAVKVEFSGGLYYAKDNGGLGEAWVKLLGEYRKGEEGEWTPFLFSKATNSSYVKSVKNEAPVGNYSFHAEDFTEYDQWHEPVRTYTIATLTYPDGTLLSKEVHRGTQFSLGDFSFLIPYEDDSDNGDGDGGGDGSDGDGGHGGGGGDF